MRLTHINLAGFKSFVDPTQIPVPGQLVGIVGPNGCGKSNIIDAVRWVLGESSAKQLRGETMQDVLFNGSGNRKPMGRCSVELIFDNSLGKATGQWSTYAEISVKRVLLREGDSTYYINNLPVRRRDVTDIFLGTGLGARAYAIIEQGMISRIIEAKPEDLRVFLEEAAGVSKYRERRRETELRLRDTRENLVRVEDIRQELTKQIEHLQSQAAVASNYHSLQNELATLQGLLWFTRKKEAIAARGRHNRDIERCVNDLESETARLRETENQLETLRTDHYTAGDALHEAQGALYEANSEVARIEQQINHIRENRQRIEHHLETLISQKNNQQIELHQFADSKEQTLMEQQGIDDRIIEASARLEDQSQKLPQAEQLYRQSDEKRRQLQLSLSQIERQHQVEQTKMGHSSALIEQLTQRKTRLHDELAVLPQLQLSELDALQEQFEQLTAQIEESRGHLEQREQELPILEQQVREHTSALNQSTQKQAAIEARLSVLSQLQANLAKGAELSDWQASRGLDQFPRVWQSLQITPGWETALE
ncbi:MAG: AAA family ATPase, partial [Betaproteobacteria bacterium]